MLTLFLIVIGLTCFNALLLIFSCNKGEAKSNKTTTPAVYYPYIRKQQVKEIPLVSLQEAS